MQLSKLFIYDKNHESISGLFKKIEQIFLTDINDFIPGNFLYLKIDSEKTLKNIIIWMEKYNNNDDDFLLYLPYGMKVPFEFNKLLGKPFQLKNFSNNNGNFYLKGKTFQYTSKKIPINFKVLAIIHIYNENDVIFKLLEYLLGQELDVYIIDNWSDDGSYEIVENFRKRFPERIFLDRFPEEGPSEFYEWYNQLEKTEEISKKLSYDWYIHYDADEMRISPWENVTLRQAIYHIDKLGYNLIENTVIDFKLTENSDESIFMRDTYFDFGHRISHFMQIKTWKKTEYINLRDSGGHFAVVRNPKIFPLKILNRHYPFRNVEQAFKKVFEYRKPRFEKEHKERGWHGHYDLIQEKKDFIQDPINLLKWNKDLFYEYYPPLFMGCGVFVEKTENDYDICFPKMYNKKLIIYGAGRIGKKFYCAYSQTCNIIAWVDQRYETIPYLFCEKIISPSVVYKMDFDYLIIAIGDDYTKNEIKNELIKNGVNINKII